MIWNETKECMSADEKMTLQSARLVKQVDRVYHNVEFYRKRMQSVGIEPGDIKGIEDLQKLPYTTKADLRDNYPFGLFAVPREQIVRMVLNTMSATGDLMLEKDLSFEDTVTRVATKGGITEEGTKVIYDMFPAAADEMFNKTLAKRKLTASKAAASFEE